MSTITIVPNPTLEGVVITRNKTYRQFEVQHKSAVTRFDHKFQAYQFVVNQFHPHAYRITSAFVTKWAHRTGLAARAWAGAYLYVKGHIHIPEANFDGYNTVAIVGSESRPNHQHSIQHNGKVACSCEDHRYRAPDLGKAGTKMCKHMYAFFLHRQIEKELAEDKPVEVVEQQEELAQQSSSVKIVKINNRRLTNAHRAAIKAGTAVYVRPYTSDGKHMLDEDIEASVRAEYEDGALYYIDGEPVAEEAVLPFIHYVQACGTDPHSKANLMSWQYR